MWRSLCAVLNLHTKVVVVVDETLTETRALGAVCTDAGIGASPGEAKGEMIRDVAHGDGEALDEIADRTGQA